MLNTLRRHRGVFAAVAAPITALLVMFAALGLPGSANAQGATGREKPTIVIVHGAWTDAASFSGTQKRLQKDGYDVLDFANPLRSLSGDSAALASFLKYRTDGPVILVGHSYGGAVITEAATSDPDVRGLVYVDAFAPAKGESLLDLLATAGPVDPTVLFDAAPYAGAPEGDVDLYLKEAPFRAAFANGLPRRVQADLFARQRPITLNAVSEKAATRPAWQTLPSWYVAGTQDHSVPLSLQQRMAARAGAHLTTVSAGHLAMTRLPNVVAKIIEKAATSTR